MTHDVCIEYAKKDCVKIGKSNHLVSSLNLHFYTIPFNLFETREA